MRFFYFELESEQFYENVGLKKKQLSSGMERLEF